MCYGYLPEYRTRYVAVHGSKVVLKLLSGLVSFIEFNASIIINL